MLEEGKVDETDRKKDEIEEFQRERRKELSKRGEEHVPRFFKYVFFVFLVIERTYTNSTCVNSLLNH